MLCCKIPIFLGLKQSDSGMLTGSDLGNQVRSPRAFVSPRAMLQSEGPNRSTDAELWGDFFIILNYVVIDSWLSHVEYCSFQVRIFWCPRS
jgi:hypothetical protein